MNYRNVARPKEAAWDNAKLYRVDFFDMRLPVSGTRLVWAVVGYKWVRICTPVQNKKFRMRRGEWDKMSTQLIKETDDERTDIQGTEAGLTNPRN